MSRRKTLRGRLHGVLTAPVPGVEGPRDGAQRAHDWWMLYGPRWH